MQKLSRGSCFGWCSFSTCVWLFGKRVIRFQNLPDEGKLSLAHQVRIQYTGPCWEALFIRLVIGCTSQFWHGSWAYDVDMCRVTTDSFDDQFLIILRF